MDRYDTSDGRMLAIVDETALAELLWMAVTMTALLVVYAIVDVITHPADQSGWRAASSLIPALLVFGIVVAYRRDKIPARQAGLITGVAAIAVAASVLYTLTRTGGPTELIYLTVLILLVGACAMRTPVFYGVVTSLAVIGAMGILVVTEPNSVAQRGDWVIGLAVSVAAAVIVHRARVGGLRKLGAAQDDLERIAAVDELTGVTSRYGFSLAFPWLIAQSRRHDVDLFALFGDVDGLKIVNDLRGHEFGDQLIKAAANALREHSRASDLVVRWGGDEFLVIGMGSAPDLGRFESAVSMTMGALTSGSDQHSSMSMGAASLRRTDGTLESLITAADNDMMRRRRERGHRHSERATSG